MEKLELKHLAPYLPYELKFQQRVIKSHNPITYYYKKRLMTIGNIEWLCLSEIQKPILKPLNNFKLEYELRRWDVWEKLFREHYDVFGLIEKGLAIDINQLPK